MSRKKFFIIIVIILLAGTLSLVAVCMSQRAELNVLRQQIQVQQRDDKALAFTKLFIEKVLYGTGEVVFDDRLKLENSVREINDQQIFDQWQNFVKSSDGEDAQRNIAELLILLLNKISK